MERRLTRSRDAMIGGVAAGLANWLNTDPALVRIVWAVLVPVTGGAALIAYIVAWIVIPEEPRGTAAAAVAPGVGDAPEGAEPGDAAGTPAEPRRADDNRAALYIGGGLVLIGLWFLVREYVPAIRWDLVWPILLVGAGVLILLTASRRR